MVPFAGWEMPVSYKGIIDEHNSVRKTAGIFDIGHMGLIKVEGEEALALIQQTTTNDAAKLKWHEGQYSIVCNESGGVIDDVFVYCLPALYLIVCNASNADKVLSWIKKQAKLFKQASVGLYENYSLLAIRGPEAEKLVGKVLNVSLAELKHNHCLCWRDIIISRTGYTGEDGFELIVAKTDIEKIWLAFINEDLQPCGLGARDTLRLEAGYPLYGHEYDEETTPLEAGYGWAVKLDKTGFIGKDVLVKEKAAGLKKKLVGLRPEGRFIPRSGDVVFDQQGAKTIGKITSGTFSPTLKTPIALAYLATNQAEQGNTLQIGIRGKKTAAKVVAKTFYKR